MRLNKGLLFVISGPSGTGKGTICKQLKERNTKVQFSVSATTRNPREGEVEGKDYFFMLREKFESMIQNNEFVEWVQYCNNYYGTPKRHIEESLAEGKNIILEIEVEGALNIKRIFPESILIFILPPSFSELKNRLINRGTEPEEVIVRRLEKSKKEFLCIDQYDYAIINDDLTTAVAAVESIITAESCRVSKDIDILKEMCMI